MICFLAFSINSIGQDDKKQTSQDQDKTETPKEADGIVETAGLLGDSLWYQFKKRFNLLSEEEEKERELSKGAYKVKLGKFSIEKK